MPSNAGALIADYDALFLDLDGVIYIGAAPVVNASSSLERVRQEFGTTLRFITNNARRTPAEIAQVLVSVGVAATEDEIVSSSQIAAAYLREKLPAGAKVLITGSKGLAQMVADEGLQPVWELADQPVAVVQGFNPELTWYDLAKASAAIHRGAMWVGTNADLTFPTENGIAPGNGSLIQAVSNATGKYPVVVGKPYPTGVQIAANRCGARHPLMLGDRLDTDIQAGRAAEVATALVMTGVTDVKTLCTATPELQPDFILTDLTELLTDYRAPEVVDQTVALGDWEIELTSEGPIVQRQGESAIEGVRAVAAASWRSPAEVDPTQSLAAVIDQLQSSMPSH